MFLNDVTLPLLRNPYRFISNRCDRENTDLFKARFLLQESICMRGAEAAELFYDKRRFTRENAMPGPALATLFGKNGIQGMEGSAHRHHKKLFLSIMDRESVVKLVGLFESGLLQWVESTRPGAIYPLYTVMQQQLTRAVCEWAGIPLRENELFQVSRDLTLMFDKAGAKSMGHLAARRARKRGEHWAAGVIKHVRESPPKPSPLSLIAHHRNLDGELLSLPVASVEVLNLLRPVVAVSVYLVDCAHALHCYPVLKQQLINDQLPVADFVQEVRRFYPFFPLLIARVRNTFVWNNVTFTIGIRVLLDIYGTNHHRKTWDRPEQFNPQRFQHWLPDSYTLIPQGGGSHELNHRCPGEDMAIALMSAAVKLFCHKINYDVPPQQLALNWRRLPAIPHDHFLVKNVRDQT